MNSTEIKFNIDKIINEIQNEETLKTIYDFLKTATPNNAPQLWQLLNEEEKEDVLLSFDESEDESNLISFEKAFKR